MPAVCGGSVGALGDCRSDALAASEPATLTGPFPHPEAARARDSGKLSTACRSREPDYRIVPGEGYRQSDGVS